MQSSLPNFALALALAHAALGACAAPPPHGPPDTGAVDAAADGADAGVGDSGETGSSAHRNEWVPAFDATDHGAFMSVWGSAADDVYAVGGQPRTADAPGSGVVFHFDGADWNELEVPEGPMLNWVHGAEGVVWMVGESGRVLSYAEGAFSEAILPTEAALWGVWAASSDDVWTVGGNARAREGTPVVFHWDGSEWLQVATPTLDREGVAALFKVWGTSGDNVFAIGMRGAILRWQGEAWEQLPSGTGDDLVSLWGRGPDDIVAVGGRSLGVLGRWDGSAWTFEQLPRVSGLNGSWMASDGTVLANGVGGRILEIASGTWDFVNLESPTRNVLHAIWALDDGPCFAVGGTLLSNPPYEGDVLIAQ